MDVRLKERQLGGREDSPRPADVSRLTATERSLYEDLREHRIRPALRLKQEYVGFRWLEQGLNVIHAADDLPPFTA